MRRSHTNTLTENLRTVLTRYHVDLEYQPYLTCWSAHRSPYVAATHRLTWLDTRGRPYVMELCLRCAADAKASGRITAVEVIGEDSTAETQDSQLQMEGV